MIDCFIVDDDQSAIDLLTEYIDEIKELRLVFTSNNPNEILPRLNNMTGPTIAFLDIEMPGIKGLRLAEWVGPNTGVIFVTGHTRYAVEAFEKKAYDYLIKPVSYERFCQAYLRVSRIIELEAASRKNSTQVFVMLPDNKLQRKVALQNISYAQALGNYLKVFTDHGHILIRTPISRFRDFLAHPNFIQIHRSYIVNLDRVEKLSREEIFLDQQDKLPIGKTYCEKLLEACSIYPSIRHV